MCGCKGEKPVVMKKALKRQKEKKAYTKDTARKK